MADWFKTQYTAYAGCLSLHGIRGCVAMPPQLNRHEGVDICRLSMHSLGRVYGDLFICIPQDQNSTFVQVVLMRFKLILNMLKHSMA